MKNQVELTPKDLYPEYGTKRTFQVAYDKQLAYVFQVFSAPLLCPFCGEKHTANELYVNSPEAEKEPTKRRIFCPDNDKAELDFKQDLFGDSWLEKKTTGNIFSVNL